MSNPFPINTNGTFGQGLGTNATFVNPTAIPPNAKNKGISNQYGGYLSYNFFDTEPHTTPYMAGTYLGNKKVFNVAVGAVYQKNATWRVGKYDAANFKYLDTIYENMFHLSFEIYLDKPLNKEKGTAISAFAGYYSTNYGQNYLRYNGIMNPGTGTSANNYLQNSAYGNAFPMFGTGQVVYSQIGYLLPKKLLGEKNGQLLPYLSVQYADYFALNNKGMIVLNTGLNWLINSHQSKISLDYQNRPTYYREAGITKEGARKSALVLQYQIFF